MFGKLLELEAPTLLLLDCRGFDGLTKTLTGGTLGFVHSAPHRRAPGGTMLEHSIFCIASEGKHWGNTL